MTRENKIIIDEIYLSRLNAEKRSGYFKGIYGYTLKEFAYAACLTEGGTLTKEQVCDITEEHAVKCTEKVNISEITFVVNFKKAFDYAIDCTKTFWGEEEILNVHKLLSDNYIETLRGEFGPGEYRNKQVYCNICRELSNFESKHNNQNCTLSDLFKLYSSFIEISPFWEFNGTEAALMLFSGCICAGICPFIPSPDKLIEYPDDTKKYFAGKDSKISKYVFEAEKLQKEYYAAQYNYYKLRHNNDSKLFIV